MKASLYQFRRRSAALSFVVAALALTAAAPAQGQSLSVGADLVSRYVWRGYDFGESFSVQPALTFSAGGFEVGAWGSYSISADGASANENDLWAAYTVSTASGFSVTAGLSDYYFPDPDATTGFGDGESHTLEASLAVTGPSAFPVTLLGAVITKEGTLYMEASYPFAVKGVDAGIHLGGLGGASDFYGNTDAGIVNVGLTASKALPISDSFAPPVSVSWIWNPAVDRTYLVFGLSISS